MTTERTEHESAAEKEGIVDQQNAALTAMESGADGPALAGESRAEQAGIVDQQDAALAEGGENPSPS